MRRLFTEIIFTLRGYLETFGASQLFLLRILAACPYALARPGLIIGKRGQEIEILQAEAHAVEADLAQQADGLVGHLARIDLDRVLAAVVVELADGRGLVEQRAIVDGQADSLAVALGDDPDDVVVRWRLEATLAAQRFLDQVAARRR